MSLLTYANASDLEHWADDRRSQEQLPEVVRRLILATSDDIRQIEFAAGGGIQLPGFDGVLVSASPTAFVPEGYSAWEMGVTKDVRKKANADFTKRSSGGSTVDRAKTTFVFVTPRVWPRKAAWAREKSAKGIWADVRVYDAHDLETWLAEAQGVHVWLSLLLGVHPSGADDLETVWRDWSEVTNPPLTPELVLAGREAAAEHLRGWLRGDGQPHIAVDAPSSEEALAFVVAVALSLPASDRAATLARAVAVHDQTAWTQLTLAKSKLVLVPTFSAGSLINRSLRGGHRVAIPLDIDDAGRDEALAVPRLGRQGAADALIRMGVSADRAGALAALARRSLLALRRKLAARPALKQPRWAGSGIAPELIAAFFAGSWNDSKAGDRTALQELSAMSYDELTARITRWANEDDPPLRRVDEVWYVIAPEDLLLLLSSGVTRDHIERLHRVVLAVLGTHDPAYELPVEQRWAASLFNKSAETSGRLRHGLARSLALLGALGEDLPVGVGTAGGSIARRAIRELLDHALEDWKRLASLAHLLPLLGEAAPDVVLEAVERGLRDDAPLLKLFTDHESDSWHATSSPHTGLLWALETIAWSADHLGRAALLLAELAKRDPGGKLGNRPIGSLHEIFVAWCPQTSADLATRLSVIDLLRQHRPEVAWRLMISLLPGWNETSMHTARPRWRDWGPVDDSRDVPADYWITITAVVDRLLADVGTVGGRWSSLIRTVAHLLPQDRERIVRAIGQIDPTALEDGDRELIWSALRSLVAQHRGFPTAKWAMPRNVVDAYAQEYPRFAPADPVSASVWLFGPRPELPERRGSDYRKYGPALARAREAAVRAIVDAYGPAGIVALAVRVDHPGELGRIVSNREFLTDAQVDDLLAAHLGSDDSMLRALAQGLAAGLVDGRGRRRAEDKLKADGHRWRARGRSDFAAMLPPDPRTWSVIAAQPAEVAAFYWKDLMVFRTSEEHLDFVVGKMLEHDRPAAAIDLLADHVDTDSSTALIGLAVDALERFLRSTDREAAAHVSPHEIGKVMSAVGAAALASAIDERRVAMLEFAYLPILDSDGTPPAVLYRDLSRCPDLFVEAVRTCYRADDEEPRELSEAERGAMERARILLKSWRDLPGVLPDGAAEGSLLMDWVLTARQTLGDEKRLRAGDTALGQVLSGSPIGADGAWPAPPVRDVIEAVDTAELREGLHVGIMNSRGVMWRSRYGGGESERGLADRYDGYARIVSPRWPRTGAFLRAIAADYRAWAAREDKSSELEQDLEG